ncbi:hypothetical protein CXG81DRAFT_24692 [Caulochytrium protostelioides]|uniref:Uncharacterized protein n=1 Tax=Caulochytrium protostelioides TaxID=1555241 RepID=A0A4V1IV31_9FUNG|nr:hypothetical protein CXG81DRAFT_24692 [Caulochytrium protostelioides]|eukprot:RKP02639.1 hypothetical protein CXG81DRAFT_24692 [Caulochytrium protostelioides]
MGCFRSWARPASASAPAPLPPHLHTRSLRLPWLQTCLTVSLRPPAAAAAASTAATAPAQLVYRRQAEATTTASSAGAALAALTATAPSSPVSMALDDGDGDAGDGDAGDGDAPLPPDWQEAVPIRSAAAQAPRLGPPVALRALQLGDDDGETAEPRVLLLVEHTRGLALYRCDPGTRLPADETGGGAADPWHAVPWVMPQPPSHVALTRDAAVHVLYDLDGASKTQRPREVSGITRIPRWSAGHAAPTWQERVWPPASNVWAAAHTTPRLLVVAARQPDADHAMPYTLVASAADPAAPTPLAMHRLVLTSRDRGASASTATWRDALQRAAAMAFPPPSNAARPPLLAMDAVWAPDDAGAWHWHVSLVTAAHLTVVVVAATPSGTGGGGIVAVGAEPMPDGSHVYRVGLPSLADADGVALLLPPEVPRRTAVIAGLAGETWQTWSADLVAGRQATAPDAHLPAPEPSDAPEAARFQPLMAWLTDDLAAQYDDAVRAWRHLADVKHTMTAALALNQRYIAQLLGQLRDHEPAPLRTETAALPPGLVPVAAAVHPPATTATTTTTTTRKPSYVAADSAPSPGAPRLFRDVPEVQCEAVSDTRWRVRLRGDPSHPCPSATPAFSAWSHGRRAVLSTRCVAMHIPAAETATDEQQASPPSVDPMRLVDVLLDITVTSDPVAFAFDAPPVAIMADPPLHIVAHVTLPARRPHHHPIHHPPMLSWSPSPSPPSSPPPADAAPRHGDDYGFTLLHIPDTAITLSPDAAASATPPAVPRAVSETLAQIAAAFHLALAPAAAPRLASLLDVPGLADYVVTATYHLVPAATPSRRSVAASPSRLVVDVLTARPATLDDPDERPPALWRWTVSAATPVQALQLWSRLVALTASGGDNTVRAPALRGHVIWHGLPAFRPSVPPFPASGARPPPPEPLEALMDDLAYTQTSYRAYGA